MVGDDGANTIPLLESMFKLTPGSTSGGQYQKERGGLMWPLNRLHIILGCGPSAHSNSHYKNRDLLANFWRSAENFATQIGPVKLQLV